MNQVYQFVVTHQVACTLAAQYTFSAFVGALPMPNGSGKFYKWFFTFSNTLAANLNRAKVGANGGKVNG